MTFTAVGSAIFDAVGTVSITPHTIGNLILFEVTNKTNATVFATAISSSSVTWVQVGTHFGGASNAWTSTLFAGKATATSAGAITITWSGTTPGTIRNAGQEFSSTVGSWALDVQGHLDGAGTNTSPSLTPAAAGELYFCWLQDSGSAVAGSTTGYTYDISPQSNGMAFNPNCTSAAQAPVWGDSTLAFGIAALMKETATVSPAPPSRLRGQAVNRMGGLIYA